MTLEQINQIENRIRKTNGIYFNRIPKKTWDFFKKYADDNWSSDYGSALTAICCGIMPPENTTIMQEIETLKKRIEILEQKPKIEDKPKSIQMLNGKILNR